jgi:hypothetical protein
LCVWLGGCGVCMMLLAHEACRASSERARCDPVVCCAAVRIAGSCCPQCRPVACPVLRCAPPPPPLGVC